jgi:hypothetical protein
MSMPLYTTPIKTPKNCDLAARRVAIPKRPEARFSLAESEGTSKRGVRRLAALCMRSLGLMRAAVV